MTYAAVLGRRGRRLSAVLPRFLLARPEIWFGLPWVLLFAALVIWQFHLGFVYKSNDTTNIYLRLARGSAFALLPVMAALWLPVMRNLMTWLERSRIGRVLPLEGARAAHRWLGHLLFGLALLHGSQYLVYYGTLNQPYADVLFGLQPDLVRSMRTNMYDFVTDDESIDATQRWIELGMPRDLYEAEIHPIMQKDCVKCHNTTSTRTYARTDMPMTTYEELVSWTRSGALSRQFRINVSGLVMLVLFAAIWVTSLAALRRRSFNAFQTTHRLGYLLAALALLHVPSLHWVLAPALVLAAELYLSRHRKLYRNCPARLTPVTEDVVRLDIERPSGMPLPAGHYVQIRIPDYGRDEWHAFSLTGPRPDDDVMVIKVRRMGDWTGRLVDAARTGDGTLHVDVRGPYASPAAHALVHRDWLLVAGGIGVTPFLSLLRELAAGGDRRRDVHLVWVLRQPALIRWIEPLVDAFANHRHIRVHWHVFVNRPADAADLPALAASHGHDLTVHAGRPDWEELLNRIAAVSPHLSGFVCGPHGMMAEVASACRRRGWPVRTESFA